MTRRARALAAALLAAVLGAACTGTFTPPLPTLYLVFLDAEGAEPAARVALLDFVATPTERRLELLNDRAFTFPDGERLLAVGVRDRTERLEAWVLTAVGGAASRATRLHRFDLRGLVAEPGATIAAVAPARGTERSSVRGTVSIESRSMSGLKRSDGAASSRRMRSMPHTRYAVEV